VHDVTGHVADK